LLLLIASTANLSIFVHAGLHVFAWCTGLHVSLYFLLCTNPIIRSVIKTSGGLQH